MAPQLLHLRNNKYLRLPNLLAPQAKHLPPIIRGSPNAASPAITTGTTIRSAICHGVPTVKASITRRLKSPAGNRCPVATNSWGMWCLVSAVGIEPTT